MTQTAGKGQRTSTAAGGVSRLGVVVVGVHIDVPQAQLVQLPDDFLHGIEVLVHHPIQGACTRVGTGHLWVGEVEQSRGAAGNDLVLIRGIQRAISVRHTPRCHTRYGVMQCMFCVCRGPMQCMFCVCQFTICTGVCVH